MIGIFLSHILAQTYYQFLEFAMTAYSNRSFLLTLPLKITACVMALLVLAWLEFNLNLIDNCYGTLWGGLPLGHMGSDGAASHTGSPAHTRRSAPAVGIQHRTASTPHVSSTRLCTSRTIYRTKVDQVPKILPPSTSTSRACGVHPTTSTPRASTRTQAGRTLLR